MKIICNPTILADHLALVNRAVPSRPTHPILGNVLLVADKETQKITLTGFDLCLGIRSSFSAEVEEGGQITLPAKIFSDIVSKLPAGEVTIECEDDLADNPIVSIDSLSGNFKLRGVVADEYPELPNLKPDVTFQLSADNLNTGLKSSIFASSTDDTKQLLTGVHLKRDNDILEFASTDGHRLAVATITQESELSEANQEESDFAVTLPSHALSELVNRVSKANSEDSVYLGLANNQAIFNLNDYTLLCRILDGSYPNYNQLIPKEFAQTIIVDRKRVMDSLERVSVLADSKNNMVRFSIDTDNEKLTLSVEGKELGNAKESISVQTTGDRMEIGFNIKYLFNGLKAMSSNEVKFHFNEPTQPVIIKPLSGLKMTYLIMPVQLKD